MNNLIKLILCAGFFCSTNFGMEKGPVKRRNSNKLQQQRVKDTTEDDACNERCLQSCEKCCLSAVLPTGTAVVLTALRLYQAITG